MTSRTATCSCGQLSLSCEGEPARVSICHCLDCQKRTGSVYGVQARFRRAQVGISGSSSTWSRRGDSGFSATFHFCATCSAIVYWYPDDAPELLAIPVGAFADPGFPPPRVSVYEARRHPWAFALAALPLDHHD